MSMRSNGSRSLNEPLIGSTEEECVVLYFVMNFWLVCLSSRNKIKNLTEN